MSYTTGAGTAMPRTQMTFANSDPALSHTPTDHNDPDPDAPTTDPTHAAPAVHREGADPTSADQPEDAGTAGQSVEYGGEG